MKVRKLSGEPPRLKLPPKATDTHMHIYDDRFPGREGGPPKPPLPASLDDYRNLQSWLGLERVVFVQGAAYQFDNACLLDALGRFEGEARGIAVVGSNVDDATLEDLTARGVRGARIMHLPGGAVGMGDLLAIDARTRPFGWKPIVQFDGRDIADYLAMLEALPGDYVVDHAGKFLEPVGVDSPEFKALLRLIDRGNCYVKISACYETSKVGPPTYADVGALSKALIQHAPERMLYATNWPHVSKPIDAQPDDRGLLDLMLDWAPDEKVRQLIFVDNPARLYGFPA
ncbi:amidohydrolase family protein [Pelagibius sp. 7325]|uniref:amidohydrolase family protein n=1 Tax=Pelagibius sp. 7325 TaxID=3131994 RepID=UPI0030EDD9A3